MIWSTIIVLPLSSTSVTFPLEDPCSIPTIVSSDSKSTAADSSDIYHVAGGHQLLGGIGDLSFLFGPITHTLYLQFRTPGSIIGATTALPKFTEAPPPRYG